MHFNNLEAPFHINWNISYVCDFSCAHCYSRARAEDVELSLEQKLQVAQNIVSSHVFSVNLGGGEPLLSTDTLPVIRELSKHNVIVALSTNGWHVSDEIARELSRAGLGRVFISVDDIRDAEHDALRGREGSLQAARSAAQSCVAAGLKVYLSTVITTDNAAVLKDIVALAKDLGCAGIELKRFRPQGSGADLVDKSLDETQLTWLYEQVPLWRRDSGLEIALVYAEEAYLDVDAGCPCGRSSLAILSDGTIAACVYNPHSLGNALTQSIAELWVNSPYLARLRSNFCCAGLEDGDV